MILLLGSTGMVGQAIRSKLCSPEEDILFPSSKELDLTNQLEVDTFFKRNKPRIVYLAAARVGGIYANNQYPADFIFQNLAIQTNVIEACRACDVERLLFLGSSCIYPKFSKQPIRESELLTGPLEKTNEAYAISKIAGLKMCEFYSQQFGLDARCLMPTNLYGPNDNYSEKNSHVIAALIRKFHHAKVSGAGSVEIWGTGTPLREFLHVDDLAKACIHIMNIEKDDYLELLSKSQAFHINVGAGYDISIKELANTISSTIKFDGSITFDSTMPDGTPRKILDSSIILSSGWQPAIDLQTGLRSSYKWYIENIENLRQI